MAEYDQADMAARAQATLPTGWFPDVDPILTGLMNGIGNCFAWLFALFSYAGLQARIATATDVFLDIAALDFFGGRILRKPGQTDASFSTKIRKEIIRPRGTRAAVAQVLTDLTGRSPIIFEPAYPPDTGGIGHTGMTMGTGLAIAGAGSAGAGGWGSLALPFQCFVTAYRATGGGIPSVMGIYTESGWAGGGIGSMSNMGAGAGAIEVADLQMSLGQITDSDIDNAIVSVMPAASIAWTRITN